MKINIRKIIIILILIALYISMMNITPVEAFEGTISDFDSGTEVEGVTTVVDNVGTTVISIVRAITVSIAFVVLLIISIRYMTSAPGDRADIKKHAIAYVIGAVVLFGVSGILTMILSIADKIGAAAGV